MLCKTKVEKSDQVPEIWSPRFESAPQNDIRLAAASLDELKKSLDELKKMHQNLTSRGPLVPSAPLNLR